MINWYKTLPNWLKAGLSTFAVSFVVLFAGGLIGFLNDIVEWANTQGSSGFPSLSTLGYAAASAVTSAVIGIVNSIYRLVQSKTSIIPGTGPSYPSAPPAE